MRLPGVLVLVGVVACSGKKEDAPAPAETTTPAQPAAAAPVDAAPAAVVAAPIDWPPPVPRTLSAADRKSLRAFLREAAALIKKEQWKEAVASYEAAVRIEPANARTYSELSWAAFQAGDHARARLASDRSVALAVDRNLKAASLYNLGRVEEAEGNKERAIEVYLESLRLRPSKLVKKRLVDLGGGVDRLLEPTPPCAETTGEADLCACLRKELEPQAEVKCGPVAGADPVDGVRPFAYSDGDESWALDTRLLVGPGGRPIALLERELASNRRESNSFALVELTGIDLGGKRVVRAVHTVEGEDSSFGSMVTLKEKWLTLCVAGADALRCPLKILLERHLQAELVADEEAGADSSDRADFMEQWGAEKVDRQHRLDAKLGADGKVTVTLAKGPRTDEIDLYLGTHALW